MFLGGQVSSIPFLLGKDRAKAAVAALVATEQGMNLIAPPVGGAIFALKGALPALLINAGTYFASTASLATVRDFGPDEPSGYPSLRQIGSDIVAGWTFIMRDRAMRMLTWIQLVYNFFLMLGYTTIIPYFKRDFLATDQQIGIAFGIFALGSVIGSIAAGKWHPSFGRVLIVTNIVGVFAGLPMIFTHDLRVAIFAFTIASMFSIYQIANIIAWRMRVVPEEMVGRVFGVIRMLVLIGVVPGSILGGIIADAYGARLAFIISSFGYLITTIWMLTTRTLREDRR
jgi:predicted MFS family arabinose efflux permease